VAIFDFAARVPGEIVWPRSGTPEFVIPKDFTGSQWCEFRALWTPGSSPRFVAGQEQFLDGPACNAFCFDDGGTAGDESHTWSGYDGVWSKYEEPNNLMLRVVGGYGGAVAPTSLGRIKALYQ
jgi:hypothetical protein